jgi:hypothetical protein
MILLVVKGDKFEKILLFQKVSYGRKLKDILKEGRVSSFLKGTWQQGGFSGVFA